MLAGHPDTGLSSSVDSVTYRRFTRWEFNDRVTELIDIYLQAMDYPGSGGFGRRALWQQHASRAGFGCIAAVDEHDAPLGFVYGYTGSPDQWWHSEVRRGLSVTGAGHFLTDYAELTELHISPGRQGHGIGEHLLRRFLADRVERRVLLSTPETLDGNRAWRLYRRLGFSDVLRQFRFSGDPRPFGILTIEIPPQILTPM